MVNRGADVLSGPIARGSGISLGIRVAGLAMLFVQAIIAARLLGPAGYGTAAVVMAVVGIVATICQMGFGALAIRDIAARAAADDIEGICGFFRTALRITLALSFVAAVILAGLSWSGEIVPDAYRATLGLGALLVAPVALIGLFRGVSQGFGHVVLAQVPGDLVRPAVLILVMVAVALTGIGFGPGGYILVATLGTLVAAGIAWVWLWRTETARLTGPADYSLSLKERVANSLPFLGLGLAAVLQGEINTLLLGLLSDPTEAGLFQPVVRLAPLMTIGVAAVGMRYAPRMSEFWQRGEFDRIQSVTRTFTWTTTLATLVIVLAICLTGPWLMWAFGKEFVASAPQLWVIAVAQVFFAACGPASILLTMSGRGGAALVGQMSGVLVNLGLGTVLILNFGSWGAAISMAAGIAVCGLVMLRMAQSSLQFDPSLVANLKGKSGT